MRLLGGVASHVGNVREANQDRVYFGGRVAALADGMGGHQGGERAAELAIGQFRRTDAELTEGDLVDMVLAANRAVHGHASENGLPGMGTTLVALTLHGDETITVANVGDSRAYWVRGDYMSQITEDHSFVEDLVRQGRLTPEEAAVHPQRNILTRAVGIGVEVEVDRFPVAEPAFGDRFLLCSDGLFNEVSEEDILEIILDAPDPSVAAKALVERTLRTPCRDNVSVAVVEIVEDDDVRLAAMGDIEVDHGVITSEYLDSDTNAITAPIPVIDDAFIRANDAPVEQSDQVGPAQNGSGVGGRGGRAGDGAAPAPLPSGEREAMAARVKAGLAVADEADAHPVDLDGFDPVDDPEAALDTAEMDVFVDDPLEVRPRSRLVLYLGSLLLLAGLSAGGYFLAQAYATAGFHLAADRSTGNLAVFEGRPGGLFGLFEPTRAVAQTEHSSDVLITLDMADVVDDHFDTRADVDAKVAEIDTIVAQAEAQAREGEAGEGTGPLSDGTSDGEAQDGSNQTVEGETVVGEGVSGGTTGGDG